MQSQYNCDHSEDFTGSPSLINVDIFAPHSVSCPVIRVLGWKGFNKVAGKELWGPISHIKREIEEEYPLSPFLFDRINGETKKKHRRKEKKKSGGKGP